MSRRLLSVYLCLVLGVAAGASAAAAAGETKPTGVKGEMLMWIGDAEDKLGQLADAIPEEKYTWRPAEGVRSTAEVLMHVAAANYGIPGFLGVKPPEGFDFESYEKSLTAKQDIKKALAESFAHAKKGLMAASAKDLDRPVEMFGMKTTVRSGYLLVLSHAHEHLGQMIAYARINGVVPPWTAKEKEKEAAASGKPAR